jgi:hypothetical protein
MPTMDHVTGRGNTRAHKLVSESPFPASDPAFYGQPDNLQSSSLADLPEWQLAERIAGNRAFSKSDLLRRFLLHVVEQHLSGRTHEINEQQIGERVFNRPLGYKPGEDNIVRNYARLLRKRLKEYFENEGQNEPLRVEIPRGGYIPHFYETSQPASSSAIPANTPAHTVEPDAFRPAAARMSAWLRLSIFGFLPGLLCGALLAALAFWSYGRPHPPEAAQSVAHPIWSAIFQNNRNTVILGTDTGLGILENLTHHPTTLDAYDSGSYLADLKPPAGLDEGNLNDLRSQRYTSFVDLNITAQLIELPEYIANRTQLRYARSISTEDLRTSNAILIGSKHTDPWVELFERQMNFRLEFEPEVDHSHILNVHPQPGEQPRYENSTDPADNLTYGTIDFLPSLDGKGHVLILQGLNMASTQAAADVLFDPQAMHTVLAEARRPDGALRPFELLIATHSIDANAPGAQILATRFYD